MRISLAIILVLVCGAGFSWGESFTDLIGSIGPDTGTDEGADGWSMGGAAGLLIEEDPTTGETHVYAQIGFQPDFSFGQFGVGLDLTLNYDLAEGEFKNADYDEDEDYLKLIRYIRYGKYPHKDGIYLKAGALDDGMLGHGFILNHYKTDVDYDRRRAGLQFNLNYEYWGLESFTNNVFLGEVVGARGAYRPWAGNPMPLINDIAFGFTVAIDQKTPYMLEDLQIYDVDNESWSAGIDGIPDWNDEGVFIVADNQPLTIYGLDTELPVFRGDMLGLTLYIDYAQMWNVGSDSGLFSDGLGAGIMFNFKLSQGNKLYFKLEQRYMDSNFMPAYFNRMYEIERYQYLTDTPMVTKLAYLEALPDGARYKGIYGEIAAVLLGMIEVWGTIEDNQDIPNDGTIEVGAGFKELAGIRCAAEYRKSNIDDSDINDMFTMDDRSLFLAYLSYRINAFMEVGAVFQREWELDLGSGEYVPVDSYNVGVTFNTEF